MDSFRNRVEGWRDPDAGPEIPPAPRNHNRVHVWVGGDMGPGTSPNDPVFYLNHCYEDRIWESWMALEGPTHRPVDGDPNAPQGHRLNDQMLALLGDPLTPAEVLDPTAWYVYDHPSQSALGLQSSRADRRVHFLTLVRVAPKWYACSRCLARVARPRGGERDERAGMAFVELLNRDALLRDIVDRGTFNRVQEPGVEHLSTEVYLTLMPRSAINGHTESQTICSNADEGFGTPSGPSSRCPLAGG